MFNVIKSIDTKIILSIDKYITNEYLINFFNYFTILGYFSACWIIFFVIYSIRKKERFVWLFWGITFIAAFFLGEVILKNTVCRLRPFIEIAALTINTIKPTSFSFPSGHALYAGASLFIFFKLEKKILTRLIFSTAAVLMAFSRVILKVHYPSDVITGFFLGIFVAFIVSKILNKMYIDYEFRRINIIKE